MQKTNLRRGAAALVLVAAFAGAASADTIFNNFGPGDDYSDFGFLLEGPDVHQIADVDQACAFTVGADNYFLTGARLGLWIDEPPNVGTGHLNIIVAEDAAGLPGAALASSLVNVTTTGKHIVSTGFAPTLLNANTTYWVIADTQDTFRGAWDRNTINDFGPGAGRSNGGPWSLHNQSDERFALEVTGRVAPVPEPATMTIFGAGALATFVRRRRAAKR